MRPELTARECQIVQLLCGDCYSVGLTADSLGISVKTVETHRANIMRKLGFHSAPELCRYYWRKQLSAQLGAAVQAMDKGSSRRDYAEA